MGWLIFRKSINAWPFRFTASKSGITTSVGNKHYRRTASSSGRTSTTTRLAAWTRRRSKR